MGAQFDPASYSQGYLHPHTGKKIAMNHFIDKILYLYSLHKPEGLTTFGRSIYLLPKSFGYKYLSLSSGSQFSLAGSGQGHWLFHFSD
jgi:hypothetical protein